MTNKAKADAEGCQSMSPQCAGVIWPQETPSTCKKESSWIQWLPCVGVHYIETIIPSRDSQIPAANGHSAGPARSAKAGHFCTVCKHFCICRRTTKDTCIWRSFLLSFVGEDSRIPENVKHSDVAISGKDCRCSVKTWALLCRVWLLSRAVMRPQLQWSLYHSSCWWGIVGWMGYSTHVHIHQWSTRSWSQKQIFIALSKEADSHRN